MIVKGAYTSLLNISNSAKAVLLEVIGEAEALIKAGTLKAGDPTGVSLVKSTRLSYNLIEALDTSAEEVRRLERKNLELEFQLAAYKRTYG